jgi:antitoxin ParD1/3/4
MPTRNVNLTEELDRFVAKKVRSGRYENASEVVRAGLRTLERDEQEYTAKLAALRAAIDEGDRSGGAEGNVFSRLGRARRPSPREQPVQSAAMPAPTTASRRRVERLGGRPASRIL